MKINKQTMLFEEIGPKERTSMLEWAKSVVLNGQTPNPHPDWLWQWFETFHYGPDQRLMLLATAVPQRVLLSLVMEGKS